jgi:radical SAM superfamily enzyme YgiQ (UPF0313 family)
MPDAAAVVLFHPRSDLSPGPLATHELPLALLSVAAPLVRAGYRVSLIDQRIEQDWRERLLAELAAEPLCVGVTATTGPQLLHGLEASALVKRHSRAPVVWGGVHASLLPEQTLAEESIDFVVQGEGELSFLELVRAIGCGRAATPIAGVWRKEGGRAVSGGPRPFIDLDQQGPLPYQLVHERRDVGRRMRQLVFASSRGCTYPCAYCYNTTFHRRRWRALSAETAVEHIRDAVARTGTRRLYLVDPHFFLDLDRARGILAGIARANLDLTLARLSIRLDSLLALTDEDLVLIRKAGCRALAVGVESGSPRMQELLRKPIDMPGLLAANRRLGRFAIVPVYYLMLGLPGETEHDLRLTADLMTRLADDNPQAVELPNLFTPYPGTELFDVAVAHGFVPPTRLADWARCTFHREADQCSWLSQRMSHLVDLVHFCALFLGDLGRWKHTAHAGPVGMLLARLYAPIARKRLDTFTWQFPLELNLARALRLYGNDA